MLQLSEHLYAETAYSWANVGAAVTEAGIVLIDCPVRPSDSRSWQRELRILSPLGLSYLIATDYHGDHTVGVAFVEGEWAFWMQCRGLPVLANQQFGVVERVRWISHAVAVAVDAICAVLRACVRGQQCSGEAED